MCVWNIILRVCVKYYYGENIRLVHSLNIDVFHYFLLVNTLTYAVEKFAGTKFVWSAFWDGRIHGGRRRAYAIIPNDVSGNARRTHAKALRRCLGMKKRQCQKVTPWVVSRMIYRSRWSVHKRTSYNPFLRRCVWIVLAKIL